MAHIDIRIELDESEEDGYVYYNVSAVRRISTDLTDSELDSVAESAHQTDLWQIGVSNAIFSIFGPETSVVSREDFMW